MLNGAGYSGTIAGDITGTWTLSLDDSLWPDESDSTARFDYIWNTFFAGNYNAVSGGENWTGDFSGTTLPSTPIMILDTTVPGGILGMNARFSVQLMDFQTNGVLSQEEKHQACQMGFTFSVETPLGTETFEDYCGYGSSSNGSFNFVNPPAVDLLEFPFFGVLNVSYCGSPVEENTWGVIKALYK